MRYDRCKKLFGEDFEKLQNSKVLVLGVGGVGGALVECLARSGVGKIVIVDDDSFEITNQNRQLNSENLGEKKVDVFSKKFENVEANFARVSKEWLESFDIDEFDLVVDAIDDMDAKVAVAHKCHDKLISSMGGAKRVDPTKIQICSVWKTHSDALAKKFRYELRKSGFDGDFEVVFSTEEPKCKELGSFMGVTGSFGLFLCSLAVKKLLS